MGPSRKGRGAKPRAGKDDTSALKIKLRGKDNAPLSLPEFGDGLLDIIRALKQYEKDYRVKFATLYLTMVDADGQPVRINKSNELTIYPYRSAADDHGL